MAKDPAFLFYPNDWLGGTMILTRHQKGAYIDLLVAQFNCGPLSLEAIKTVLGQDQAIWTVLSSKFKVDGNGNYFNERLEAEKQKRIKHSEKQRENVGIRWNKSGKEVGNTMVLPLEDRNENCIQEGGTGETKWNTMPGQDQYSLELPEVKVGAVIQLMKISKDLTVNSEQVLGLWETFKIQCFTGKKFYAHPSDAHSHFINWVRTKDVPLATGKKDGLTARERHDKEQFEKHYGKATTKTQDSNT